MLIFIFTWLWCGMMAFAIALTCDMSGDKDKIQSIDFYTGSCLLITALGMISFSFIIVGYFKYGLRHGF